MPHKEVRTVELAGGRGRLSEQVNSVPGLESSGDECTFTYSDSQRKSILLALDNLQNDGEILGEIQAWARWYIANIRHDQNRCSHHSRGISIQRRPRRRTG